MILLHLLYFFIFGSMSMKDLKALENSFLGWNLRILDFFCRQLFTACTCLHIFPWKSQVQEFAWCYAYFNNNQFLYQCNSPVVVDVIWTNQKKTAFWMFPHLFKDGWCRSYYNLLHSWQWGGCLLPSCPLPGWWHQSLHQPHPCRAHCRSSTAAQRRLK